MKKTLLLLMLACMAFGANAQDSRSKTDTRSREATTTEDNTQITAYVAVKALSTEGKPAARYETIMSSTSGRVLAKSDMAMLNRLPGMAEKFTSNLDLFNFMGSNGWRLVHAEYTMMKDVRTDTYYFEKQISK